MSFVFSIIWGVFAFVADAYAIWLVWGWHGVAVGLPTISLWRAAGVSTLWSIFALRMTSREDTTALIDGVDTAGTEAGERHDEREARMTRYRRGFWLFSLCAIVGVAKIAEMLAR